MNKTKFENYADIQIKYDTALERNLENTKKWKYDSKLKDPKIQAAIRLLFKEVDLYDILDIWPAASVFELLDRDPKERFADDKLENIVRHVWKESIPEVLVKHNDGHVIAKDRIITYCFEVEIDGYGCETGWLYFDFAVFANENFGTVAFAGTFKTSIDILHANEDELETWLYAREWKFEKKTLDELEEKYNKE